MDKFLKEFKDRGYFYQCTNENELSKLINKEKIKGYIGFDCTAESLHVGSLLQICLLYTSPSPRDTRESRMPSSA